MAMVASNLSGHMQKQLTRSLERILEEAYLSGELKLSGRKLKDFPKIGKGSNLIKYNLQDTVIADLSKNRFTELPEEVTQLIFLEKLYLYHNAIRVVPDAVAKLQSLSYLDLSRNQLTSLPREVCRLPLQTLLIAHNRLVSLPEELARMSVLAELDAGCNEITSLPSRIGDLSRIRYLDLRNNFLVQIPIELTYLKLIKLDISGNRISVLPIEFRKMKSLVELELSDNPLTSPPATLCIRGRTHIFKYLERQAAKHERARGARCRRGPLEARGHTSLDIRSHRRHNIDSGYNTSDGLDKRWSQEINTAINDVEVRDPWHKECSQLSITLPHEVGISGSFSGLSTPSTISPGENTSLEDDLGKVVIEDQFEKKLEQSTQENEDTQKHLLTAHLTSVTSICHLENSSIKRLQRNDSVLLPAQQIQSGQLSLVAHKEEKRCFSHIQTYREYKEALRQQRANEGASVYRPKEQIIQSSNDSNAELDSIDTALSSGKFIFSEENINKKPVQKVIPSRANHPNSTIVNTGDNDCNNLKAKIHEQTYKKPSSPVKTSNSILTANSGSKFFKTTGVCFEGNKNPKSDSCIPNSPQAVTWNTNISFTMRREFERAKEEADLIEQLRNHIETRLKMTLPENLAPALMDGVVLCHLANHVKPRSVASIHVPSPAVPKLTMARCRRNVDNFLEACRKIGVDEEVLLDADAILDVSYMDLYGLETLGRLVSTLILCAEEVQDMDSSSDYMIQDRVLSSILFIAFISTLILLYLFPTPG